MEGSRAVPSSISIADKCLNRIGTTLSALISNPDIFSTGPLRNRLNSGDKARYMGHMQTVSPSTFVDVTFYDNDSSSMQSRDNRGSAATGSTVRISLGSFVEYVDQSVGVRTALVVGCLISKLTNAKNSADLLLVLNLGETRASSGNGNDSESGNNSNKSNGNSVLAAKLPSPTSEIRIVPCSAVVSKLEVDNAVPSMALPSRGVQGSRGQQLQENSHVQEKDIVSPFINNQGFIVIVKNMIYGLDNEGAHAIGSYDEDILSVARSSLDGLLFATTSSGKLLTIDVLNSKVKPISSFRFENSLQGTEQIKVYSLNFADGRPARFANGEVGRSQMFGLCKSVVGYVGDCICEVSTSGQIKVVLDLGRKDVIAMTTVPLKIGANESQSEWAFGESDRSIIRFIVWTEQAGMFVFDENRKTLQQYGGNLVQSLSIHAITFDLKQDHLYAVGKSALYLLYPNSGQVVQVHSLKHLSEQISSICAAPKDITKPLLSIMDPASSLPPGINITKSFENRKSNRQQPQQQNLEVDAAIVEDMNNTSIGSRKGSFWSMFRKKANKNQENEVNENVYLNDDMQYGIEAQSIPNQKTSASGSSGSWLSGFRPSSKRQSGTSIPTSNVERSSGSYKSILVKDPKYEGSRFTKAPPPPVLPTEGTSQGELSIASIDIVGDLQSISPEKKSPEKHFHGNNSNNNNSSSFKAASAGIDTQDNSKRVIRDGPPYFPVGVSDRKSIEKRISSSSIPLSVPIQVNIESSSIPNISTSQPKQQNTQKHSDISTLLIDVGLEQYIPAFKREELTEVNLLVNLLNENEKEFRKLLQELGISKLGHREKILYSLRSVSKS